MPNQYFYHFIFLLNSTYGKNLKLFNLKKKNCSEKFMFYCNETDVVIFVHLD